jgi:actin
MSDELSVILDCGSGTTKCGFSSDTEPTSFFPSVIGRPRDQTFYINEFAIQDQYFIGAKAQQHKGILSFSRPMKDGIVQNFEDQEKIWEHCFYNELRVDPKENPVIMSEPPRVKEQNREDICQTFFENLEVPALYIGSEAVMSCYATGRQTA